MSSWKKRLYHQISDFVQSDESSKRTRVSSSCYFDCPQCRDGHLAPMQHPTGVSCSRCELIIPLDISDLSLDTVTTMMTSAQSRHRQCHLTSGQVFTVEMPDGTFFLTWTCQGCKELEILL
ncbi:hypothetical protein VTP01DRAFT_6797 [Rhizomucor pusillus]|uniref:uncharacterized protein n=1 Tax=Rhizomucor pusillus TaxID=4840 RepID=UPI0037433D85